MLLQLQMLLQLKILDLGTGGITATQHHEYHDGWLRSHQHQLPVALPIPTTQIDSEKAANQHIPYEQILNHINMWPQYTQYRL